MSSTQRYRVLESLGRGGMGEVFLADDTQLGRKVAIKFLAEALEADETARERLHREARSAAALDHPYVCKIYELADIDGRTGIVMEHVTGETLQARLRRAALSPKEALEIASEVAEAMEAAHKRRLIHRDLKTSNVMLTDEGHVKVMDFGLAKTVRVETPSDDKSTGSLTDPGVRVGTPGSMAPEQLLGGHVDERSDIFAFGILLYELLAGVHPFTRASPSGTMAAILKETPAPISQYARDAPESARVTLDRLLAKEPHQRYQSFGDLRTDLGQLLRDASRLTPVAQAADGTLTSADGRTPFVGRESERTEARRLLERAVAGQGGVLLLGGEPGVGKTRLAEEVLEEGRQRGCLALTGRCYETEGTPPFIPWVEIVERSARIVPPAALREALGEAAPEVAKLVPELRQVLPDIPRPIELPPEKQRRYLFNNFVSFVERVSRVTPQVWLIDDLHWADDSTLLLLQHVVQRASEIPLLIVGTYRDVDLEVARPFAKVLEAFTRQRLAHKVGLQRLHEAGVADMLRALGGADPPAPLVTAIYGETEGNPFFVEEVFQHLSEEGRLFDTEGHWRADLQVDALEVPEGVRLVIGRRVERLSSEARQVLATAAIVGRSFHLALLEALGDAEGDALLTALEEAETAKLIQAVPSDREARWVFAHGLIRQTLESGVSLPRRQRAHLRVAEAVERVYAANIDRHATDLGHHLFQAGMAADPCKTVGFLTLAGQQALEAGAFDEALRRFDRALSIEGVNDQRQFADLVYKKGQALRSLGRSDAALEQWRAALAAYERLGDGEGIARTVYDAAWVTGWGGYIHEARTLARRGLDTLGDNHKAERCRLLAALSVFSAAAGDEYQVSQDVVREAEAIAESLKHAKLTAITSGGRANFHFAFMELPAGVEVGRRAIRQRRELGELYDACEICWSTVWALQVLGRLTEAREMEAELDILSARVGHVYARWCGHVGRTYQDLITTGDLSTLAVAAHRDMSEAETANITWGWAHVTLGMARFYMGEWAAALSEFDKATRLNPKRTWMDGMFPSAVLLARAYIGEHDVLDRLTADRARLLETADKSSWGAWERLVNVVEGLAQLGQRSDASDLYSLVLAGIRKGVVITRQVRLWQMVAGIAAACGEHWDMAQEHYETALRQAHELPHVIAQPEVRRWYAQMLLDRNAPGDRDKARTLLGEAIAQYRTIGMPKHLAMAEGMLKTV